MIDVVEVKTEIAKGKLEVVLFYGKILLRDTVSGESAVIGEIQIK